VFLLLLVAGCQENPTEPTAPSTTPSIVTGNVVDLDYNNPIRGAQIIDLGTQKANTESDSLGNFSFSFISLSSTYTTVVTIKATGFFDTTLVINVEPNKNQTLPTIRLRRDDSQAVSSITSPGANKAAQVAYISTSASDIAISGVGALENAVITYEVRDSLGRPVAKFPRYGATFSIEFFPNSFVGGGTAPRVIPSTDSTDVSGRLRASVVSGTEAGVIVVVARVTVDSAKVITSSPVRITVHGGFPDQNHFTLMPSHFVFPSMESLHEIQFTVAVGDTFSNPVPIGTAVYFHSQAGMMQTGFKDFKAYTDLKGLASVNLMTVNPPPNRLPFFDSTIVDYMNGGTVGRIGYEWVYAQTQSRNGAWVRDSVFVVWNTPRIVITGSPTFLSMPHNGISSAISITVKDANGNPLCDGTKIDVSFTYPEGITGIRFGVTGGLPAKIPIAGYARFPGTGITDFTYYVNDNSTVNLTGLTVTMTVTITPGQGLCDPINLSTTISLL
jgi:hypothetical protein